MLASHVNTLVVAGTGVVGAGVVGAAVVVLGLGGGDEGGEGGGLGEGKGGGGDGGDGGDGGGGEGKGVLGMGRGGGLAVYAPIWLDRTVMLPNVYPLHCGSEYMLANN